VHGDVGLAPRITPSKGESKLARHYDPNQPRVPRGHDDGGQWTKGIPESLSQLDAILNPHGEGSHAGNVQLAFLDSRKPSATRFPKIPGGLGIILQVAQFLHSYLSKDDDGDGQQTILSFRIYEFRRNGDKDFDFDGVRVLIDDEIKKECGALEEIQGYVNRAFDEVNKEHPGLSPGAFGMAVHKLVEKWIKANPELENVKAEITFAKADSETGIERPNARDTVRLDVFIKVDDKTLCIADIKTGNEGLSYNRMLELVAAASKKHEGIKRVIVTRVRPDRPRRRNAPTLQHE
jgi:hypothetical protein